MPNQKRLEELRHFSLDDEANQAKTVTDLKNKRKDVQEKRMACKSEKLLKDEKKGGRKRRLEQNGGEGSSKMSKRCFLPTESSDEDDLVSKSELEKMKTECDKANRKLKLKHKENIQLKKKNDRLQELNVRLQDQLLSLLRSTTQQHTNRSLLDIPPQTEENSKKEKNANEGRNLMSAVEENNSSPALSTKKADSQSRDEEIKSLRQNSVPSPRLNSSPVQKSTNEKHDRILINSEIKKENDELKVKIDALTRELENLKNSTKSTEELTKKLKRVEDALSDAKSDLRVSARKEQQIESVSSSLRKRNRDLSEKLKAFEETISNKTRAEEELKDKLKTIESELSRTKSEIERIKKPHQKQNMDPMAIHRAAEEGDLRRVRQLIEAGASVDSRNEEGRTPLLEAANCGHRAVVEFLINYNLDPKNHTPSMLQDIGVENEGAKGLFLEHDDENYTLLHFASAQGWADIAQTIIEKGSQSDIVNAATKDGITPFLMAAMHGQEDVAALLLRSGADVNARDIDGETALHRAALDGHAGMVKLLLQEKGLDLNPQYKEGWTPLHVACYWRNNVEVIQQLLVAGANAYLSVRDGDTPLSIYLKQFLNEATPSLEEINLFVQRGAFFQDRDYSIMLRRPVLKENVLKNVDLCTQSVINKFSYHTLPSLYSSPYFASILPPMDNFMLTTSQKEELKISVRSDIQQNMLCNVVRVRPTALSALCIQCLATHITSRK